MFRSILFLLLAPMVATAAPTPFQFPTENRHLLTGEPEKFYMYVDRTFEGKRSTPWQGGAWGLVRTPIRVGEKIHYMRFHEGIDISPIKRDKAGNPLDLIMSVADGTVVHVSDVSGRSNYGRYIVVAHPINPAGDLVHSLYAHLAKCSVKRGDRVKKGSVLGQMGYTGRGLNRTRAHLHLEIGLMMSNNFEGWFKRYSGGTNYHANYNGMNLIGIDVPRFLLEQNKNPSLDITDFIRKSPAYFKVTVPRKGAFEFAKRHPWLVYGDLSTSSPSWEISFTAMGLPTGIAVSQRKVSAPIVSAVQKSGEPHRYMTRGLLSGEGTSASLSTNGKKLVALITGDF
ncbi:MAG: M23 family metallopeptidase [Haloferula sp.]